MATKTKLQAVSDDYLDLVRRFPLVPIKNDRHLKAAHLMIDELSILDEKELSEGQADYLAVLSDLTSSYEASEFEELIAGIGGLDVLKHLAEEHQLSGSDIGRILGHRELGSKILSGSRRISRENARALAKYFGLPPDLFLR